VGLSTVDSGTSLRLPQWWALTRAAVVGGYTALFFIALLRRPRSRPLAAIVLVLLLIILRRIDILFPASQWLAGPAFSYVRSRLATDGLLAGLAAVRGWITLVLFAGTQGIKQLPVAVSDHATRSAHAGMKAGGGQKLTAARSRPNQNFNDIGNHCEVCLKSVVRCPNDDDTDRPAPSSFAGP
jgi:hypothetical protein